SPPRPRRRPKTPNARSARAARPALAPEQPSVRDRCPSWKRRPKMRRHTATRITNALVFVSLSACGGLNDSDDDANAGGQNAAPKELVGVWESTCTPSSLDRGRHAKDIYTFQAGRGFERRSEIFVDAACTQTDLTRTYRGAFTTPQALQ